MKRIYNYTVIILVKCHCSQRNLTTN